MLFLFILILSEEILWCDRIYIPCTSDLNSQRRISYAGVKVILFLAGFKITSHLQSNCFAIKSNWIVKNKFPWAARPDRIYFLFQLKYFPPGPIVLQYYRAVGPIVHRPVGPYRAWAPRPISPIELGARGQSPLYNRKEISAPLCPPALCLRGPQPLK